MAGSNRSLLVLAGAGIAAFLVMRGKKKEPVKVDAYVTTKEWEQVQNLLLFLGYQVSVTGVKDAATEAALVKLQIDNHLPITGDYDSDTQAMAIKMLVVTVESQLSAIDEAVAEAIAEAKAEEGIITMTMIEDIIERLKAEGKIPADWGD